MNPSGRNGKTGGATARNSVMREEKSRVRIMHTGRQVSNFFNARNGNDSIDSSLAFPPTHLNVSQKINSISGKLIEIRERVCIKKNGTEDKQ